MAITQTVIGSDGQKRKPTIRELAYDTRLLYDQLKGLPFGEVLPYEAMTKLLGRDIRDEAHGNLQSARRMLLNHDGIVIGTVRKVGVKKLNDQEIVITGEDASKHVRRSARRALRRLAAVRDYEALPAESKISHNTFASALAAVVALAKPAGLKRIETEVRRTAAQLPLARTLAAFAKKD